jgi:hypothetical protein
MTARTRVISMLASLCVGIGVSSAQSQDAKPEVGAGKDAASDTKSVANKSEITTDPQAPKAAATAKFETPAVLVDDKHLESILGKDVHSASGDTLGNVTDILVDDGGNVRAAIIDFGGFLGVGVRKIAIAWPALHFAEIKSSPTAVLNMNKDQLRVAPEYHSGEPIVIIGGDPVAPQPTPQGQ